MQHPDFNKYELIPAIIQDYYTLQVLMLGYMNEEAFNATVQNRRVTFFSRKRNKLWVKGETSGNYLYLMDLKTDCDNDTLLIKAIPEGAVCHTGAMTCFSNDNKSSSLQFLEDIIKKRSEAPEDSNSYTRELLKKGPKKIAQKVGEEAVELALEAMDNNPEDFINEAADLMYHYIVLLHSKGGTLNDVVDVLKKRHKQ